MQEQYQSWARRLKSQLSILYLRCWTEAHAEGLTSYYVVLSILYLRCRYFLTVSYSLPRILALSILYLRCASEEVTAVRSLCGLKNFQFSI